MKAFQDFDPSSLFDIISMLKEIRYFPARVNPYELDELYKLYGDGEETVMEITDPFVDDLLIPDQHPLDTLQILCDEPALMEKVLWYNWSEYRLSYVDSLCELISKTMMNDLTEMISYSNKTYSEFLRRSEVKEIKGVITTTEIPLLYRLNIECAENTNIESVKQYCYARATYWSELLKKEGYKEQILAEAHLCIGQ